MRLASILLAAALLLTVVGAALAQNGAGTRTFNIDAASSTLRIRVFKDGALAMFAHDHVLTANGIGGLVVYHSADVAQSSLQLSIPVGSLIVDAPEERKKEGLKDTLDEDDIAEIRSIIVGADYLDETNYPRVVATTTSVQGEMPVLSIGLNVRLKQVDQAYTVPVNVAVTGNTLRATGEVYLKHSDFGMKPYRAMLGTIAVQDPVLVKFDIVAHEQRP